MAVVATVFKNSEPIDMYNSPDRHYVTANDDGIANGLLVIPSRRIDSGCTVRCAIIRDGHEVASTSVTTVYVGGKFLVIMFKMNDVIGWLTS